jgi:hypothetical protein
VGEYGGHDNRWPYPAQPYWHRIRTHGAVTTVFVEMTLASSAPSSSARPQNRSSRDTALFFRFGTATLPRFAAATVFRFAIWVFLSNPLPNEQQTQFIMNRNSGQTGKRRAADKQKRTIENDS